MELMSITISSCITLVSRNLINQFIAEKGYCWLKKIFFRSNTYQNRLIEIIHETIEEFEAKKPTESTHNHFPFYCSQILFDELNKHILFNNPHPDYNFIVELLKTNTNIIIPSISDLETFYELFTKKIHNDNKLKKLFVEENYKDKIYDLGKNLNTLENKIDIINSKLQDCLFETTFQPDQNWFEKQCKSSIDDLGKRYTPELNVKLEISEIFQGLGRTEKFKGQATKLFDQFLIKGKQILKDKPEIEVKESLESLENYLDELHTLFDNTDLLGTNPIPVNEFDDLLNKAHRLVQEVYDYYIKEERKVQKEKNNSHVSKIGK